MKFTRRSARSVAFALFALPAVSSAQLSFFDGSPYQRVELTGVSNTDSDSVGVTIGGKSATWVLTLTATSSVGAQGEYDGVTVPDALTLSTGAGISANLWSDWYIDDPLGLDLTAYGDRFRFFDEGSDLNSPIEITVWNGAVSYSSGAIAFPDFGHIIANDPMYEVGFSQFGAADLTSVTRVQFKINGGNAADISVSGFQVVPEPSAALLAGLAGSLVLLRRRRAC